MPYEPLTTDRLLPTDAVRYHFLYKDTCRGPGDPENDGTHIHNYYEIYVNLSGDVGFLVGDRYYKVQSGDMILTRPGELHVCVYNQFCRHMHFCLWIEAPANSPLVSFMHAPDFDNCLSFDEEEKRLLIRLFQELDQQAADAILLRTALLCRIMEQLSKPVRRQQAEQDLPEEFRQILTYLNGHFRQIQYIHEIYDRFYVSHATLNRWFRKYLGISPREYLESQKLAYARKLLEEQCTVTETAGRAGFSDCSYFIAVFKKRFGVTPLIWQHSLEMR